MKNCPTFPLTLTQTDIYFDQLHRPQSPLYNVGGYIRFAAIDVERMAAAQRKLVETHDAFGIRILNQGAEVVQTIVEQRNTALPLVDFSAKLMPSEAALSWLQLQFETPMPFEDADLFRSYLLKISAQEYWYVSLAHHLAMDGWGFSNLSRKLGQYYNDLAQQDQQLLTWQEVSQADQKYLESSRIAQDRSYWQQAVKNLPDKLLAPQFAANGRSGREIIKLDAAMRAGVQSLAREIGVGVPQVYLALLAVYLQGVYDRRAFVLGIPVHNRSTYAQKQLLGVFTSVSPLLVELDSQWSFAELVHALAEQQKRNLRHQRYPLGHLVRDAALHGSIKSLYDIGFNYLKLDSELDVAGETASLVYLSHHHEATPLMLTVWEYGADAVGDALSVELQLDYNHAYFDAAAMSQVAERFVHLLQVLPAHCQQPLSAIEVLPANQLQKVLHDFNPASGPLLEDVCIHELFEAQVQERPTAEALRCGAQSISYQELNQRANQVAHYLQQAGVKPDSLVGVCVTRSIEMVVALLGILKAGAAYVPLDPSYPPARLEYMLQDSAVEILLTQTTLHNQLPAFQLPAFNKQVQVLDDTAFFSQFSSLNLARSASGVNAQHLAYIIYTSGSTGQPKGVAICHSNTVAMLQWARDTFSASQLRAVLASTSLNFDLSVFEVFVPLSWGHTCVIVHNALSLLERAEAVSLINTVPSAMKMLLEQHAVPAGVEVVNLAGEPLTRKLVNDLFAQGACKSVYNLYGPSEDTTYSTYARFDGPLDGIPGIGKAIAHTQLYVLSSTQRPLSVGVVGELYIGGAGLARGYLNRPELTAEKFVNNPFQAGTRLYRTGDMVRWLPDGSLDFLGRADDQVKIRGFRIELGEIESQLSKHARVKEAVVLARGAEGERYLAAYVVAQPNADGSAPGAELGNQLRQHLQASVADYMVPAVFVMLDAFPLSPNGKIDKRALPEPNMVQDSLMLAASTPTEQALVEIWQQVLKLEQVSAQANFFEIGGHSLLATSMVAALNARLQRDVSLRTVFAQPRLDQLAAVIDQMAVHSQSGIAKLERSAETPLALSFMQQRLWFIDQLERNAQYNMPGALRLTGPLQLAALQQALQGILQRHEVLRTTYHSDAGQTQQRIHEQVQLNLPLHDLRHLSGAEAQMQSLMAQEAAQPFDLERDLMLRASVLQLADAEYVLLVTLHHIAADGWSIAILIRELASLYRHAVLGSSVTDLPTLAIQYADFAAWQREYLSEAKLAHQLAYWQRRLHGLPQVHSLPLDKSRPPQQQTEGRALQTYLPRSLVQALQALAQQQGATLFMLLQSAFAVLLARYSNENEIVMGTPIAGRNQPEVENLIGLFVNTLVLRTEVDSAQSFQSLLAQSKQDLLDAYAHQELPFEKLVEVLQPERSLSHAPLFQILFALQNTEQNALQLHDVQVENLLQEQVVCKFDLELYVAELDVQAEHGMQLSWHFATSLFEAGSIARMAETFGLLLAAIVAQPQKKLQDLALLSEADRQQLQQWNANTRPYPQHLCIHQLFEAQVVLQPEAIAVRCGGTSLSYAALNQRANQVAHCLLHAGVQPDSLVGLCVERSLDMVVGLLGILKSGAAYVPLDPTYPVARLEYMMQNSAIEILLTQSGLQTHLPPQVASVQKVLCLDLLEQFANLDARNPLPSSVGVSPEHLAYVIYTSGSTGQPKGVAICHRNTVAMLQWARETFTPSQLRSVLASTSLNFDLSVFEIFVPLSWGHTCVVVNNALSLLKQNEQVSLINTVPSAMKLLLEHAAVPSGVEVINLAGEPLSRKLLNGLLEQGVCQQVFNLYGPSEDTTYSTYQAFSQPIDGIPGIGRAISNTSLHVLSSSGQMQPLGAMGELFIGGAGLARGYLNRPDLTVERFIANPFDAQYGPRLYRTGDIVRWLPDGSLAFFGRADDQVKIRGFRIELGEIETQLSKHPLVKEAVVMARGEEGERFIAAYLVPQLAQDTAWDTEAISAQLRDYLHTMLADYMVPAVFVVLDAFPLSPNGKIDKRALPEPNMQQGKSMVAASTPTEQALVEIWQQVLKLEQVSAQANFFEIGGHSLLATSMLAALNARLQRDVSLRTVFAQPRLDQLAAMIDQMAVHSHNGISKLERNAETPLALSFMQQRLWFIDQLERNAQYNMPGALRLTGPLQLAALQQALQGILQRHEVLRTTYHSDAGQTQQRIHEQVQLTLPLHDLRGFPELAVESEMQRLMAQEAAQPFDLERDLMLRASVVQLADAEYVLLVTLHHIAADGWSIAILIRELASLYRHAVLGSSVTDLPTLAIQYADFAAWQREYLSEAKLAQQLAYWQRRLHGLPQVHSLPLDKPRPPQQQTEGRALQTYLPRSLVQALQALAQQQGATLFMLLQSAFAVLLARYSNENEIVMGTPIAGRNQPEVENLIGLFVNTLVLRTEVDSAQSFQSLLAQSKQDLLDAYAHQELPFEKLVEVLQPERSLSHAPLFQILFALQNTEQNALQLHDVKVENLLQEQVVCKFDLELYVAELDVQAEHGMQLSWHFATSLFEAGSIARMAETFGLLLAAIVAQPQQKLQDLALLSEADRQQLQQWNANTRPYPQHLCIHQLFEAQVVLQPEAIAVRCGGTSLSYAALNERANQVAHCLLHAGVQPDSLVGLCVERSLDMVVGLLGILKSGAAYVPLDPTYPVARLEYMMQNSAIEILLTQSGLQTQLPPQVASVQKVLCLDLLEQFANLDARNPLPSSVGVSPEHLAYVIYTSGSTGQPKGVAICHRNTVAMLQWAQETFTPSQLRSVLASTSLNFDLSVFEIFVPLSWGHTCVVVNNALSLLKQNEQVSLINTVPSAMKLLLEHAAVPSGVEVINLAGEPLSRKLLNGLLEQGVCQQVFNLYGPSEDTTYSTYQAFSQPIDGIPGIGRAISNTSLHVLSSSGQMQPLGAMGELYIGGAGLARGYLNRPDLTVERFIANPFDAQYGPRLYRTGDIVRWLPDGSLAFFGRADDQVKIRGFRIELGEIETQLSKHPLVKEAVVMARGEEGERFIAAYLVPQLSQDTAWDTEAISAQLRDYLHTMLADYMVPAVFVVLDAIPLSPNGKIDKRALPEPNMQQGKSMVAASTPTEQALVEIWQQVLKLEQVSAQANFFEIGGHSLLATSMLAALNARLQRDVSLRTVFAQPRLDQLAAMIDQMAVHSHNGIAKLERKAETPLALSFMQQRLWFIDQLERNAQYNMPSALHLRGPLQVNALQQALQGIVQRHEILRSNYVLQASECMQMVRPLEHAQQLRLSLFDLRALAAEQQKLEVARLQEQEAAQTFDLEHDLMLRASLLQLADDEHVLLVTLHHIAADGWSIAIVIRELSALYRGLVLGQAQNQIGLAELPIQYADFAHWQREYLQDALLAKQLTYWQQKLQALPQVHSLPLDMPRPPKQQIQGQLLQQVLPQQLLVGLQNLAQRQGATLFMVLQTAFAVLLARYSNENEIVMGTPIAGRHQAELENLVGLFVNTLVLRTVLPEETSFNAVLAQSKQDLLDAYAHQDLPFEKLVESLRPERSLSHAPLFQILFTLQNTAQQALQLHDLAVTELTPNEVICKVDLELYVREVAQGLQLDWQFASSLFEASTIGRMADSFALLLQNIVAHPEQAWQNLALMTTNDRAQLQRWNATQRSYRQDLCLHQLFELQVAAQPQAIALRCGAQSLTYAELNQGANRLAHYLRQAGARPDSFIGLCIERSLDMVLGLLGILKAGAAYVPLDPAYPAARLEYMLQNSAITILLTQSSLLPQLPPAILATEKIVCLDQAATFANYPSSNLPQAELGLTPQHLAYVIYTSGSTGLPKGVAICHSNAVVMVQWAEETFSAQQLRAVLASTSLNFDLSVFEIFVPLSCGHTCVVVNNALALLEHSEDVSMINTVPSAMKVLLEQAAIPASVEVINLAGEPLPRKLLNGLFEQGVCKEVFNLYGPSEDTTYSTYTRFSHPIETMPSIGRAISNTSLHVVSRHGQLQPVGAIGELYIGGEGLARGYLNRPDLSAERFIQNPFDAQYGARLYRTGDVVRWQTDGNLAYLGRADDQVKIRGFRIELGEIEAQLARHAAVKEAVVLARGEQADKALVAYLVLQDNAAAQPQAEVLALVRQHLQTQLADYMLPALMMVLPAMPLTPNGKIDKRALPEPDLAVQQDFVAPATATERALAEVWQEVLDLARMGVAQLSAHANFFEIGGHSLLLTQMIHAAFRKHGLVVAVKDVYQAPTVAGLAQLLDQRSSQAGAVAGRSDFSFGLQAAAEQQQAPLSFAQMRIWFAERMRSKASENNIVGTVKLRHPIRRDSLLLALGHLQQKHAVLRTQFVQQDGLPVQVVLPSAEVNCQFFDVPAEDVSVQKQLLLQHAEQSFDIQHAPLFSLVVLQLAAEEFILQLNVHHLIADGWTLVLFFDQLLAMHDALAAGTTPALPSSGAQFSYLDYVRWQQAFMQSEAAQLQEQFWRNYLRGRTEQLALPFQAPAMTNSRLAASAVIQKQIAPSTRQRLLDLAKHSHGSLFNVMHAALALLLARLSGEKDLNIGIPVAQRSLAGVDDMFGIFLNNLPVRSKIDFAQSFVDLLKDQVANVEAVLSHQELPFEKILEVCEATRNPQSTPLFQVFLNMLSLPKASNGRNLFQDAAEFTLDLGSKFNLTLYISDDIGANSNGMQMTCTFNQHLLARQDIEILLDQYTYLLAQIGHDAAQPCGSYTLRTGHGPQLPAEEVPALLAKFSLPDYTQDMQVDWIGPVQHNFEKMARQMPQRLAMQCNERSWTYGELKNITDVVAQRLQQQGVRPGDVVAILTERNDALVIATLAVLKVGAAFMMLSQTVPQLRLLHQVQAVPPRCLISLAAPRPIEAELQTYLDEIGCQYLSVSADTSLAQHDASGFQYHSSQHDDLAYIAFTSGTEGRPKAIRGRHSSLSAFMPWMAKRFGLNQDDRFGMLSGLVHDPLHRDMFTPLCMGAALCVPEEHDLAFSKLNQWLLDKRLTVLHLTPSLGTFLSSVCESPVTSLRIAFFVGEIITTTHLKQFKHAAPNMRVINIYGSTETGRAISYHDVEQYPSAAEYCTDVIPVGIGIENVQLLVLNENLQPCGIGEQGQIATRSRYMSLGYHQDANLNAQKFIRNPFTEELADKIYLTGDTGRYRRDGVVECHGRTDKQIKIRGFRVELSEIQVCLSLHPAVKQVAVSTWTNALQEVAIAAFVITQEAVSVDELLSYLAARLPDYMVPAEIVFVESIPLNENGKLDQKRLPAVGEGARKVIQAPANELEAALLRIWQDLFQRQDISVSEDFFRLGGHSLLATQLFVRIEREFGQEMSYKEFFAASSIVAVAARIEQTRLLKSVQRTDKSKRKMVL